MANGARLYCSPIILCWAILESDPFLLVILSLASSPPARILLDRSFRRSFMALSPLKGIWSVSTSVGEMSVHGAEGQSDVARLVSF